VLVIIVGHRRQPSLSPANVNGIDKRHRQTA